MVPERYARSIVWVALGLALLTAGCLAGSDDEAGTLNETDIDQAQPEAAAQEAADGETDDAHLAFEGPDAVVNVSENASFTLGDGSFAGGWLRGADTREHDLTQDVPVQAPVAINVTISYAGEISQLNSYWSLDSVEVYDTHYFKDFDTNTIWMELLVTRPSNGGSVAAIVQADLAGESPEREYSLDAEIRSHGSATLPYVPTSVPVTEASGGFAIETHGGDAIAEVLVWGPDGFVDRLEPRSGSLSVELGDGDPTGRYVVFARPSGDADRVPTTPIHVSAANESQTPDGPLRIVETQETQGDWHDVSAADETTWTFNRSSPPVQAGMLLRPSTTLGAAAGPGAFEMSLSSPAGTLVEFGSGGFLVFAGTGYWFSSFGHENLVAGTYEGQASAGASTDWQVAHVVHELAR